MKNLKIKYKIVLAFIVLITGFAIVNIVYLIAKDYQSETKNFKNYGSSIIQNTEPHITDHVYLKDIVELQRIINYIQKSSSDILYIFLLDPDNKIIVQTGKQAIPSDLLKVNIKPIRNIELLDFGKQTVYDFSYPMVDGKLGIIRLGLSRDRLIQELKQILINKLIILLAFIILGTALAIHISRLITNPLSDLVHSAERISKGDFKHSIKVNSKDEISVLSVAFNTMCQNLQNLTNELEDKIKLLNERNDEYAALNEEYLVQNEDLLYAKEKAEESDMLKSAFIANLSHEIRTPMNGILGFTDLLKDKNLSSSKQQKYVQVIEQSGKRMLRLIKDLIDISKIEAGQVEIEYEQVNLNSLFNNIYTFFFPEAESKGISLKYVKDLPDNDSEILTDHTKLEEIMTNLINNALKFTSEGSIQFGYKLIKDKIQLWVKDSGIGIPEEMKEAIFERFRQVNNKHLDSKEGSGLGLAICKAYVQLMGGGIWVESEPGKGSSFYFTLPYSKVNKQKKKTVENKKLQAGFENIKVLIAEDNEESFFYLNEILIKHHIKIIRAYNGKEAIAYLHNNPDIKLILMDLKMPVLNGIEATREIRKTHPDVPIIAQTAYASDFDQQIAISAGCNDFITKPINKNELIEKLNHIF